MAKSKKYPDPLFVTRSNEGTENEYFNTSDSAIEAVNLSDQVTAVVAEYKLVRTFKARVKESLDLV